MPIFLIVGRTGTGKTTYIKNHFPNVRMYVNHEVSSPSPQDIMDWLEFRSGETIVIEDVAKQYIKEIGDMRIVNDRLNTWVFSAANDKEIPVSIRLNAENIVREPFY